MGYKYRTHALIGIVAAVVAVSACVSNPVEQITRRSTARHSWLEFSLECQL